MKKLFTIIALCFIFTATAQQKVKEVVSDDYSRNSLSIVVMDRGDSYDATVFNAVSRINTGDKFDLNLIPTQRIPLAMGRENAIGSSSITVAVSSADLGKEIVSYWYNRKDDGSMDDSRIVARGHYNATDQDYLNAQAAKVGSTILGENGHGLVQGSYVMVLDYSNIKSSKNDKGKISWSVTTNAHVYQIDYPKTTLDKVYNTWIYSDDNAETIAQKNADYGNIKIGMIHKASSSYTTEDLEDDGGLRSAIARGYGEVIASLENKIAAWNVTTSIASRRPLKAKIGLKEGLKNGNRYQAYKFKETANGNLQPISKGYIRATKIADNRSVATGASKTSEFYQISGGNISEGMLIKQRNDAGMGVSIGYKYGGIAPYNISIDYLAHINTKGFSQYGLLDFGIDVVSGSKTSEKGISDDDGSGITYLNLGIGYGFGIRLIRHVELMPFVKGGGDYMMLNSQLLEEGGIADEDDKFSEKVAWFVNAGLRVNVNIKYPLQLFAQVDYTALTEGGAIYKQYNDALNTKISDSDKKRGHRDGVGVMVGLKWTF